MNDSGFRRKSEIKKPVAIVVEGADYLYLLLSQIDGPPEFDEVQLWNYSDVGNVKRWLELFKALPDFATVTAIGVIRDAEENRELLTRATQKAFLKTGFKVPSESLEVTDGTPRTGMLIMPNGEPSGCLEHAVLSAVKPEAPVECAEQFQKCVDDGSRNDNWRAKVKVHALIAASRKPSQTLGQSAKSGLWDFDAPSLRIMLDFIRSMCSSP